MINSCLEGVMDVEEGKLEEELVDKPGTTIGTKFSSTRMSIRVHRKAFLAIKLLAYLRGLSLSRIYPILFQTVASSCVCTSPLAVITVVGLLDVVTVQRNSNPFCRSCASTLWSLQQILFLLVQGLMAQAGTNVPKVRRMLLFFSFNFWIFSPTSTLRHGHLSLLETDPQILELVSNVSMTYQGFSESNTSDWFQNV